MRKIIVLFITALLAITNPVFAEDMDIQSTLIYTCEDSFCINIPETIIVGEETNVEAIDVNIAPDKMVKIDLSMPNDYVEIYSVNKEDIIGFLQDKNVPGDEIVYNDLADEILDYPPEQGYLTISNALQWRLQYARVIALNNRVDGVVNYEW